MPDPQPWKPLLRAGMPQFIFSLLVIFVAVAALAVYLSRRRSRDRTLLWFSLFAGLYGVRAFALSSIGRALFDAPRQFWLYLFAVINNTITTPSVLFFLEFYGEGWKSSLRWLLYAQAVWGAVALAADIATGRPGNAPDPSNLILITVPLVLITDYLKGYRPRQSKGTFIIFVGFGIFLVTVLMDHLRNAGLTPWRFTIEPAGFLANLACLAYVAIQRFVTNEQQLVAVEEEMKAASRIQTSILPHDTPRLDGFRIAVRYRPMTAVAGDFYDFLPAERGAGILVADVTGHGVPAALVASMVKVAASSQAAHAADPALLISALNQMMYRQARGQFLTAGYLFLDAQARAARYAAAGHPPLLVWRSRQGPLEEFLDNGLLMGVRPQEQYANTAIPLNPGDRLLLYTDGIPEAANPSQQFFGEERLKEFIALNADLNADGFADALLEKISAWSGAAQSDDITLAVIDVVERC